MLDEKLQYSIINFEASIFSGAFHQAQTQESCGMLGIIIILYVIQQFADTTYIYYIYNSCIKKPSPCNSNYIDGIALFNICLSLY